MRTGRTLIVLVLAMAALAVVPSVGWASDKAVTPAAVDVVLAIDGTGSMRSSIAQAKQDSERLIAGFENVAPDLRVGVVVFRYYRHPAGEYELLQPLTDDDAAVHSALDRVRAVPNPAAVGTEAAYSFLFRRSYSDPAFGWRPEARKVLVVIGDAEPYSAGKTGLAGCRSQRADPQGLDAADELARMRARNIVLLMVRQVSPDTSTELACYEALAQRAALGSAARDGGGRSDLVGPVVSLLKQVFAPLQLQAGPRVVRREAKVRYVLTLTNRSSEPMKVDWLQASLPRGLRYQGASITRPPARRTTTRYSVLVWYLKRTLAPGQTAKIIFTVRAMRPGKYRVTARGQAKLESGLRIDGATRAPEVTAKR